MADSRLSTFCADYLAEVVSAVARHVERDAERVRQLLSALELHPTPERPIQLSAGFLFHLGMALRFLVWEAQGIDIHLQAGMPTARQTILDAFRSLHDPDHSPMELYIAYLNNAPCGRQ